MGKHRKKNNYTPLKVFAASSAAIAMSAAPATAQATPLGDIMQQVQDTQVDMEAHAESAINASIDATVDGLGSITGEGYVETAVDIVLNSPSIQQIRNGVGEYTSPEAIQDTVKTVIDEVVRPVAPELVGTVRDRVNGIINQWGINAVPTPSPIPEVSPESISSVGSQIVEAARSQIGTPYVWGGSQPGGFDCSGLTSWAYSQVGKHIPRTSQDQAYSGVQVSTPEPGDIVSFYSGATHVGIYAGGGMIIHAPQSGDVVKEVSMDYMPVNKIVRF